MEIPGYFYDEKKRRYFKISNGAVSAHYHNNFVESDKRRRKIETARSKTAPSAKLQTMGHKYLQFHREMSASNMRLGLVAPDASAVEFQRLQAMRAASTLAYSGSECYMWAKMQVGDAVCVLVTNQDRTLQAVKVGGMLGANGARLEENGVVFNIDDHANSRNRILELINRCNLLPYEYLTVAAWRNLVFANLISESDLDNPQLYQNICRLLLLHTTGSGAVVRVDKTGVLYSFVHHLTSGEIKKDLCHLFGMSSVVLHADGSFDYDFSRLKSHKRFFVTSSCFKDGFFVLGTNLGIIYLIPIEFKHNSIRFSDSIIKFRFEKNFRLDKITRIDKMADHLVIVSYKKIMIINISTHAKFVYSVDDLIKNTRVFQVLDQFVLVVVSFKKVTVLAFSTVFHRFEVLSHYDLFNNNINQHSIITFDMNLVFNQTNHSLLVVNLKTFESHSVALSPDNKINGLMKINDEFLLVNCKNPDNTSTLTTFSI